MAKTKYDRIEELKKDIGVAELRIKQEEAKVSAAQARIKAEKKRIRDCKERISQYETELLAEKFRASNISLEDALAAIDLQSDSQPDDEEMMQS